MAGQVKVTGIRNNKEVINPETTLGIRSLICDKCEIFKMVEKREIFQ